MSESLLAFASQPPVALNLEYLQDFLDRTLGRIMIGEMFVMPGVSAGCRR